MEKTGKVRLFSAVTLFVSFLCIAVTFGVQMRMQSTLRDFRVRGSSAGDTLSQTENSASAAVQTSTLPSDTTAQQSETETAPSAANIAVEGTNANNAQQAVSSQTDAVTKVQTTVKRQTTTATTTERSTEISPVLVVNVNTKKIHSPWCSYLQNTNPENTTQITSDELQAYLDSGYTLCQRCGGYVQ